MKTKKILILIPLFCISLFSCNKNKNNNEPSTVDPAGDDDIPLMDVSTIKGSLLNRNKNPLVKWEGRYEYKAATEELPSTMYLYHAATGFTVDFIGTKLEVSFVHYLDLDGFNNVNIYYDYAIDDETLPNPVNRRFHLSKDNVKETITLCEGLTNKQHTVKCLKMSEAKDAYTGVYEIKTDGKFVYRDVEADNSHLKFMFICASGGSGYGALAYSEEGPNAKSRKISNSSALHSFNYLTARRFNADVMYVATSGWGVRYPENKQISQVLDKVGVTPSNDVNGALTTGDWNKDKYIPDVIIFNIGGNDTKNSAFNATNYKARVVEMVRKMHSYYPLAKMLWTHTVSNAGGYAISELTAQGIMSEGYIYESIIYKVGHGEVGSGEGTYGASEHYSLKTQIDSAKKLTEQLQDLGYTPTVDPVSFSDFNFEIEF
ncbi:MAG: hypothetical protein IKP50_01575 [Bacilli bacterium]|nr:hypothetical protein [Bacilli bacterium]